MNTPYADISGHPNADELLKAELTAAGDVTVVTLPVPLSGVPSSRIVGHIKLPGDSPAALWQFIRCRNHWQCQGPGIPPKHAEALHASHGEHVKAEGLAGKSPSQCFLGFAVGYYEVTSPAGLKALVSTIYKVITDAQHRQLLSVVTDKVMNQRINELVGPWLFPGDCDHTPDAYTMAKGRKFYSMLQQRMQELRSKGINPLSMTTAELLPGVKFDEIELNESDF